MKSIASIFLAFLLAGLFPRFSNPALPPGNWTATGSMTTARWIHTATLLPDGRVFVAGGMNSSTSTTNTAEIYDPSTGLWTPIGSMAVPRSRHTATLLHDGRVLITGGRQTHRGPSLATSEIYDPASNTWISTGTLNNARDNHAAVLLEDGRVLVAGGVSGTPQGDGFTLKSAEIYDPQTGAWIEVNSMVHDRFHHQATKLTDGRVLVTGGNNSGNHCVANFTTEIFDPQTGLWSKAEHMNVERKLHSAFLLPDGSVIVIGGITLPVAGNPQTCQSFTATTERFDPASTTWQITGNLSVPRNPIGSGAQLLDGKILIAGGFDSETIHATTEIYDPGTGHWTLATPMLESRRGHTLTLLPDGRVLASGGGNLEGILSTAEIFTP